MIVSHSNMKAFSDCELKFYFQVKKNLRPKEWPAPIQKGFAGHDLMEKFFTVIFEGGTYEDAIDVVQRLVTNMVIDGQAENAKVFKLVAAFGAHFMQQPWEIVEMEKNTNYAINNDQNFGYTPDLICRWTQDAPANKRGLPFVLDYKFTGQYWNDRQINTVQQMPKYLIYYNKEHGLTGSKAMRHAGIVMLNTRAPDYATGNQLFLLKWLPITKTKLETIERENEEWIRRIEPAMRETAEEFLAHAIRTPNEFICKTCWFADDLCPQLLNGESIESSAKANYLVNDYGYN